MDRVGATKTQSLPKPEPAGAPTLSVILVNYNSWPDVARVVKALWKAPEVHAGHCEIIVVDNASATAPPLWIANPRERLSLILRAENGGFSVGVNTGWKAAKGRWLLLLNPDVMVSANLIRQALERVAFHESRSEGTPGVIGFGLRNPDGTRQPSVGIDPGLFRSLRGLFLPRSRRKYQADRYIKPGPVDWVTGACVLVAADVLERLNGMDEDFFLYYEEVALCRAARDLGRRVEYDPSVEVVHLQPLQNRPMSAELRVITRHSKLLYFRKHLPRWQFWVLSWIITMEGHARERLCSAESPAVGRALRRIASRLRSGHEIVGTEVRDLAGRAASGA